MTRYIFDDKHFVGGSVPLGFERTKNRIIALGYFDGVHLGHRKIMEILLREGQESDLCPAAQTFSSIPISKRKTNALQGLISTTDERCSAIEEMGVSEIMIFPFSERFSEISAIDYLNLIVMDLLGAKAVVVGHDYRFGSGGVGDVAMLRSWGEKNHVRVISVDPVLYQDRVISSSWIREALDIGDVKTVAILMGRPIAYSGIVVRGKQLGRTLGFPTANIIPSAERLLPQMGVYVSELSFENKRFPAVTNIGVRPTVDGQNTHATIETVILNANLDLYGQEISVFLLEKLRDEILFSDIEHLKKQVMADLKVASDYHGIK